MLTRLEVLKTDTNAYTVIVDGKFADCLTIDETMGCIASALFSDGKPLFVRTYVEWMVWAKKYRADEIQSPIALLGVRPC